MRVCVYTGFLGALLLIACTPESGPREAASESKVGSEDLGSSPDSPADSLLTNAESLYQEGEIDAARALFEEALKRARATGDVRGKPAR